MNKTTVFDIREESNVPGFTKCTMYALDNQEEVEQALNACSTNPLMTPFVILTEIYKMDKQVSEFIVVACSPRDKYDGLCRHIANQFVYSNKEFANEGTSVKHYGFGINDRILSATMTKNLIAKDSVTGKKIEIINIS